MVSFLPRVERRQAHRARNNPAAGQPAETITACLGRRRTARALNAIQLPRCFSGPKEPRRNASWERACPRPCVTRRPTCSARWHQGKTDTIAYVLPNSTETVVTLLGGMVAGIVAPINPLLEPEQIRRVLSETKAKAVVTLKASFTEHRCRPEDGRRRMRKRTTRRASG